MRKGTLLKRLLCAALSLALMGSAVLPAGAADGLSADGAAFGTVFTAQTAMEWKGAWVNDSADYYGTIRPLVNSQELHPQKTGWAELDARLEEMKNAAGGDTCYQLWYMYDWLVKWVTYGWRGYSYTSASVAAYNSVTGYDHLSSMHHDGLPKTVPDDMANRTYSMLTGKVGVCYDYAIAFAVMARYLGIESYVHTGYFAFETGGGGHHGWTILVLDGNSYIFDPQRDARNYEYNGQSDFYFGIPAENGYRYSPDSSCAGRDASMLPVNTGVTVSVVASRSGTVSGAGRRDLRSTVTLTAKPKQGKTFAGWYDADCRFISKEPIMTFSAEKDRTVYALFSGDRFCDVTDSHWYRDTAMEAAELGLVEGVTPITFAGDSPYDRAMAVTMLSRVDGADVSQAPKTDFQDVPADSWYERQVAWAFQKGVTEGKSKTEFAPLDAITRQEFIAMAVRYAEGCRNCKLEGKELSYPDAAQLDSYAVEPVKKAQAMGLIQGDKDTGKLRPKDTMTRAEATAVLLRLMKFLEREAA